METRIESLTLALAEQMLDQLPHASFNVKDNALRYIALNSSMIDLCGVHRRTDVLGRSARDFFSDASRFEELDHWAMRTRRPVRDKLALSFRIKGDPAWIFFGKWPILAPSGAPVGVLFVARTLEAPNRRHPIYERLSRALEFMHDNFTSDIDLASLAKRASVSVTQLERDFIKLVGMPPRRYLTKLRVDAAVEMLERSNDPIVIIAHACGYSDQSAFTRRFQAVVGMSPSEYRRIHKRR